MYQTHHQSRDAENIAPTSKNTSSQNMASTSQNNNNQTSINITSSNNDSQNQNQENVASTASPPAQNFTSRIQSWGRQFNLDNNLEHLRRFAPTNLVNEQIIAMQHAMEYNYYKREAAKASAELTSILRQIQLLPPVHNQKEEQFFHIHSTIDLLRHEQLQQTKLIGTLSETVAKLYSKLERQEEEVKRMKKNKNKRRQKMLKREKDDDGGTSTTSSASHTELMKSEGFTSSDADDE